MKALINLILPTLKIVFSLASFLIGIGWATYAAIHSIVRAEGVEIRREVGAIREIDIKHIDKRFDKLEKLIKEEK